MTEQRMTNADAVVLCRMAKAACPQQQFDQYTPDMWHELLGDLRFEDARMALVEVVKSQPFVSPAEIRDQVKRIRGRRIDAYGPISPPDDIEDTPAVERVWFREMIRRIGDGELQPGDRPEPAEVLGRAMPDWKSLMPSVPRVERARIIAAEKAKDSAYAEGRKAAEAELAARRPIPTPEDAALAPAEDEDQIRAEVAHEPAAAAAEWSRR